MLEKLLTWITYSIVNKSRFRWWMKITKVRLQQYVFLWHAAYLWYQIDTKFLIKATRRIVKCSLRLVHWLIALWHHRSRLYGIPMEWLTFLTPVPSILKLFNIMLSIRKTTTTVYFYYCRQTTKRIYKNIIISNSTYSRVKLPLPNCFFLEKGFLLKAFF